MSADWPPYAPPARLCRPFGASIRRANRRVGGDFPHPTETLCHSKHFGEETFAFCMTSSGTVGVRPIQSSSRVTAKSDS